VLLGIWWKLEVAFRPNRRGRVGEYEEKEVEVEGIVG
jgi:hypothetical protein